MGDIDETISEAVDQAGESNLNNVIALVVAIAATFMALADVKAGNNNQLMDRAQARMVNSWGYFQAKSTKQNIAEASIESLKSTLAVASTDEQRTKIQSHISRLESEVARYKTEKDGIKAEAEGYDKQYDLLNNRDDQFDLSEATLSVSIALCGIAALTQKWPLFWVAVCLQVFGVFFGMAGFFNWDIHPDFLMSWLS